MGRGGEGKVKGRKGERRLREGLGPPKNLSMEPLSAQTQCIYCKSYLPVAEVKLWTRQATCSFAYLISETEAFDNWQNSCDVENRRAFPQLVTDNTSTAPADDCIHLA